MQGAAEVQFAHLLAGNEKKTRDIGVKKLKKWFYAKSASDKPFTENELLRIWKGLFYCFWMSDKPLIQEELSERIGAMIETFATEQCSLLFLKTFFLTMGREWFGLDKWRMDKFMMLVRRFVRDILKYNRKREWNTELANKISDSFKDDLFLLSLPNSMSLQLHVCDVFLEELAKVGGEDLSTEIINIYMEPFYKILVETNNGIYRNVVINKVFHHLLRQSDCGIEYEVGKDVDEMDIGESVEVIKEEDLNVDEGVVLDPAEEMEIKVGTEAEDPRAGNVSVEIPQLTIDYSNIAEKLFQLGSTTLSLRSQARRDIYKLSEDFKQVASGTFPLTDEISDDEVEKIDIEQESKKLAKREMKIKERNKIEQKEFDIIMAKRKIEEQKYEKQRMIEVEKMMLAASATNVEENDGDEDEDENGVKRKMEDGEEEDSPETKKAKIEESEANKERQKEVQRNRKREQKRRKREKLLAEQLIANEKRRKADLILDKEMEIQVAVTEQKVKEPKKKIKEVVIDESKISTELTSGKKQKKKKDKKELEPEPLKNKQAADSTEKKSETEVVKKKKNKSTHEESLKEVIVETTAQQNGVAKKKKKNKAAQVAVVELAEQQNGVEKKKKNKNKDAQEEPVKDAIVETAVEQSKVEKKKKKKVALAEAFKESIIEPTQQQNGVAKKKKNKIAPQEPVKETIVEPTVQQKLIGKKKKKRDKGATIEKAIEEVPNAEDSNLKKKKKKKDKEAKKEEKKVKKAEEIKEKKNNIFDEPSEWDTPLQDGETEIILPSKKYKGDVKLAPAAESTGLNSPQKGFEDFSEPTMTTPKITSHTAKFLKKAMSKSATPKKKLSQIEKLKSQGSSSESKKRVNWALSNNMFQGTADLLASIKSSPGIPHDPKKQPEKGLLKTKSMSRTGSPALNPVALNTQLNASLNSKKGLKMQKRLSAQDFF